MASWHPDAKRVPYSDAGGLITTVDPRLVWHTTETTGLPRYSGSAPHFTLNPRTGELWQHIPINRCAKALENRAGGVETNRANAIQVELLGYAKDTQDWPVYYYRNIAELARWIERNAGVARRSSVTFEARNHPMTYAAWLSYSGHCGHQNVPEQAHWDPGKFRIDLVLGDSDEPYRRLRVGDSGDDVRDVQRWTNKVARNVCRDDHLIEVDGAFGPFTQKHSAWALWMRGVNETQEAIIADGLGVNEQRLLKDWDELSAFQKARARARRSRHSGCGD